jgi:hypothetical protein
MALDSRGDRGGGAEGLVLAAEVVVHEVKADRVGEVLDLLGEPVGGRVKRRIPIRIVRF